ncbi:hypothetical protein IT882_16055 [Microbacterium schleiferi]|uniref:2-oxoglutarate dehydrogenase n=1 Tax=Microbacterium schleiferi TaxID=69362 RepID=A0A7S8MYB8_9MICO|nr:DUF6049 family protein [Microbacterium schleiferi]QPE04605.1 hypothetical protein IT882_16055 [Microbacterium schleiferi]
MTAPTPLSASVPPGTAAPRRWSGLAGLVRRASATLAIAVLVAAGAGVTGVAPAAATTTPSPSPTASDPQVVAAPLAGGVVSPGDSLAISIGLTAGTTALPATQATVSVGTDPLATRSDIDDWLASPAEDRAPTVVGTASLDPAAADERASAIVRVPASDPVLTDRAPGVYPVLTTVTAAGRTLQSASVFVIPTAATTDVAVIVPITAPPTGRGLLSTDDLAGLTAQDGSLTAALTGVQGTDAIIAVDPAILAAIRVLGTTAPATARDWLTRFEALPNDRFALQFGDADPAAQVAAGVVPPLAPTSLAAYIDPTGFAGDDPAPTPTPTGTATPSNSDTDDASGLPTLDELMDVGATTALWWPESVTADVLSALGAGGTLTITATTAIATPTPPARARAGEAGLLVTDADLSAALSRAADAPDALDRSAALAEASALEALPATGGATIVALDRNPDRTAVALRAAIDAAQTFPGARPLALGTVISGEPGEVSISDEALATARVDAVPRLLDGEQRIETFASVIADPTLLTGVERAEILQLLSLGWTGQDAAWAEALDTHAAATQTTLSAVGILPPSPIQLVAADAEIPVGIRNDLPYPVTVTLHAHSDDLRLEVAEDIPVEIGPEQSTRASLPVKARVGSGTVEVDLSLTSPTGVRIGPEQSLEVNVRADWETIGLIVLSVLAAAFLLLGAVRTVRRIRRRPEAEEPETAGPDTTTDADTTEPPKEQS